MTKHCRVLDQKPADFDNVSFLNQAARELQIQQGKINDILSALAGQPVAQHTPGCFANEDDSALAKAVRKVLADRDKRKDWFGEDLFSDPAWDMLLELLLAELHQQKLNITAACAGSRAPPTTALRWVKILEERGLVRREPDRVDARRSFIMLSRDGSRMMRELLKSMKVTY